MRVLVVDDDAATRGLVERILATEPGIDVAGYAATAEEGTALAEAFEPDVIVLDIVLGAQDGRDVIGALRLAAPRAAVLVLTVLDEQDAGASSVAAGADAFRTKSPALYSQLADELRALGRFRPADG